MINSNQFTFLDQTTFENESRENLGDFPHSRQFQKHIQRGFLVLDKPVGPTSHDVIATVKKILNINKAGHLGTLDPNVSGVLPIGLEDGTKILSLLAGSDKRYICNLRLHDDVEEEVFMETLRNFTGEIYQFPPLKSNVAMKLRKRTIYQIKLIEKQENEYLLDILCQAGTYIRVLCIDIGKVLGVGGEMKELRRINSASFSESETYSLHDVFDAYHDVVEGLSDEKIRNVIKPIEEVITTYPGVIIRNNAIPSITNGAKLAIPGLLGFQKFKVNENVRILSAKGELVALGTSMVDSKSILSNDSGFIIQPFKVIFTRDEYSK